MYAMKNVEQQSGILIVDMLTYTSMKYTAVDFRYEIMKV